MQALVKIVKIYVYIYIHTQSFPDGSAGKDLPTMQETWEIWVQSLCQEDPLEEGMTVNSNIFAWRIP